MFSLIVSSLQRLSQAFPKNVEIGWHLNRGLMRVIGVECGVSCCEWGAGGAFIGD